MRLYRLLGIVMLLLNKERIRLSRKIKKRAGQSNSPI